MSEPLLKHRNRLKSRKPNFQRQDVNKYRVFKNTWRRPKGIHNKLRQSFRGNRAIPAIGYGSPRAVAGLTSKGFVSINVSNVNDLNKLSEGCAAVISSTVGMRKRLDILMKAKEKNLGVLGVKDFDAEINNITKSFENRKKKKKIKEPEKKGKESKSESASKDELKKQA